MIYRAKNSQHPADYSHETHLLLAEKFLERNSSLDCCQWKGFWNRSFSAPSWTSYKKKNESHNKQCRCDSR
jgi:hypothetical protein